MSQEFFGKFVGRRLYIPWSNNMVVSLSKIAVNPERRFGFPGSDADPTDPRNFLITDLFDTGHTLLERSPGHPVFHVCLGHEIRKYFLDPAYWTKDEREAELALKCGREVSEA